MRQSNAIPSTTTENMMMKPIRLMKPIRWMKLIQPLLLWLLLCLPLFAEAQLTFDYTSVESYIRDHKNQRSLLIARATLEYGNQLLHDYSKDQIKDYKELNFDLDRYTRAFDVIDMIYQSLRLGLNVYSTYDQVSERLGGYRDLLDEFNEKVIRRGKLELADTLLVSVNYRAIRNLSKECEYLYKSVYDLVLYVTGAAACSTADLMVVLESINTSLDKIRWLVNRAYIATWNYVQSRIGYWKEKVYRTKTKQEMIDDAFGRWRKSGITIKVN